MVALHATDLLRPGALAGVTVAAWPAGHLVAAAAEALGATLDDAAADVLIADAGPGFRAAGGGLDGMRAGVDGAFGAIRDLANERWIPAGSGRAVLVGPRPGDGAHAAAARAACENLVRTLGTEWARHGITPSALLPADDTPEDEVAALCCFLAGGAGGYYAGSTITLAPTGP